MDIRKYMTKDTAVMLGILAALVLIVALFVYMPQQRKIDAAHAKVRAARNALRKNAELAVVVPAMMQRVEQMRQLYDRNWERKLPDQTNLGDFVGKVAHFRDIEGLSGSRIEPGSPEQTALYNALPIVVNVHGSFASLARFLYRLEAMDRLVRIEEMTIEADTDQTPTQVDVMLRMSIYHRHAEI